MSDNTAPEKKHEGAVPIAPSLGAVLRRMVIRIDTLLFPTPGATVWYLANFYLDVWRPAQDAGSLSQAGFDGP